MRVKKVISSKLELDITNADTVAGNFKTNAWVEIEGYKIQSSSVAYIKTYEKQLSNGPQHKADDNTQ